MNLRDAGLSSSICEKLERYGFNDTRYFCCPGDADKVKSWLTEEEWTEFTEIGNKMNLENLAREVSEATGRKLVTVCGVYEDRLPTLDEMDQALSEPRSLQLNPADPNATFKIERVSSHEDRVRQMMQGFGQECPTSPTVADYKTRELRVRLMLEEVMEYASAAGVDVAFRANSNEPERTLFFENMRFYESGDADLVEMADALADVSVTCVGSFVAHSLPMDALLEEVDENNLLKIKTGSVDEHGKFVKAANHPAPKFMEILKSHGWCSDE